MLRDAEHGVEIAAFYLRANRKSTDDEVARLMGRDLPDGETTKGLTRTEMSEIWSGRKIRISHLDWGRRLAQLSPLDVTGEIINFLNGRVVAWNPPCFTATGLLEGPGVLVRPLGYRFTPSIEKLQNWLRREPLSRRPLMSLGAALSLAMRFETCTRTWKRYIPQEMYWLHHRKWYYLR